MPHLHEGLGQHDLTASAFIVRTDGQAPTVMLHLHRKIGRLMQFGGHIELDETPWQGLARELREESGYDLDQLAVLQPPARFGRQFEAAVMHPLPFYFNTHRFKPGVEHFHSDLTYAMLATQAARHPIGEGESAAIHRFTAAQITALPDDEIYDVTRASALYILEHLMSAWDVVPAQEWVTK